MCTHRLSFRLLRLPRPLSLFNAMLPLRLCQYIPNSVATFSQRIVSERTLKIGKQRNTPKNKYGIVIGSPFSRQFNDLDARLSGLGKATMHETLRLRPLQSRYESFSENHYEIAQPLTLCTPARRNSGRKSHLDERFEFLHFQIRFAFCLHTSKRPNQLKTQTLSL